MKLELKTISQNHLDEWNQTKNGTNIIGVKDSDIKAIYKGVFEEIADLVNAKNFVDFTHEWRKICKSHCGILEKHLNSLVENPKKGDYPEQVNRAVLKFRGNLAEILFEAGVQVGAFDWIRNVGYEPVDPHHEQQLDGVGWTSSGKEEHKIGIQVKNWRGGNNQTKIGKKVFAEVEGMAMAMWNRGEIENLIRNEIYGYVVSFDSDAYFADGVNEDLKKDLGNVRFVDAKTVWRALMKRNRVFQDIVDSL